MKLEEQIQLLAESGIQLNEGVSIDDLLYSFSRDKFESKPFHLLFFMLGIQVERPPYAWVSSMVWNFDTECINSTGDYVKIVKKLCAISGDPDYLKNVSDFVDLKARKAWLRYDIDGVTRDWTVEVVDDWVDLMTFSYIIEDIERDGKKFFYRDNGQAMVLFFLDHEKAQKLNQLSNNSLKLVNDF